MKLIKRMIFKQELFFYIKKYIICILIDHTTNDIKHEMNLNNEQICISGSDFKKNYYYSLF